MAENPLQTVTFQAAKTNSAPPLTPLPLKRSSDGPLLIGLFNALGLGWILSATPAIALVIAACIFGVSLAMRRNIWAKTVSLVASCAVAFALIAHPPEMPSNGYHNQYYRYRAQSGPLDAQTIAVLYLVSILLLGLVHKVAGEPDEMPAPAPIPPKPPEDPEAVLKKKGFDHWLKNNITLGGDAVLPVDAVYDDYRKSLAKHIIPPPAYGPSEFKAAFRSAAGKEPVEIKGILSYQGVSFAGGGLI